MMRAIIATSLKYRFLTVAVAGALLVLGLARLRDMPIDVFPEFAPPYVAIQAEAQGLSTVEVEDLLTLNLEEALTGTARRQTIRSASVPGLASLILVFEPGTDPIRVRQYAQERLTTTIGLPKVARPPQLLQPLSATSRVMMVGLSSNQLSPIDLSTTTYWKIRPRLMAVPGVANVAVWGQKPRQLQVRVEPEQLRAHRISLDQVVQTTGSALWVSPLTFLTASTPGTGGWIDTPQQRIGLEHLLPIRFANDLAQLPIEVVGDVPIRVGDVAQVVESYPPLIGDAVLRDGSGLMLVVEKSPGSNTLEVTRGVDQAIDSLRRGLPGIEIDSSVFRPATYIELALSNLATTLLIGALLVIVVLGIFLFEWRVVLITLLALPLSLVAAGLVLYFRGATLNTMVLAGFAIALGALVDDAIIDIENIVRRLRLYLSGGGRRSPAAVSHVILEASLEVRSPIIFATFIIVLAVVPVFFMEGVAGAFFQPLASSYALALLASMVVALTVTPALALIFLFNAPIERRQSPIIPWLHRRYTDLLSWNMRTPRVMYAVVALLVVCGIAVVPFLGQSLLPAFKESDILIQWDGPPSTSQPEMSRIAARARDELRTIPGVRNVNVQIGRAIQGDQIIGVNSSQIWVSLDPKANYDGTAAAIRDTVGGYPGMLRDVQTYLQERIREVLAGSSEAIVVRVYGYDFALLESTAEQVRQAVSTTPGIADLRILRQAVEPQLEIKVDLARAERYGIKPGDVRRAAATVVAGLEVGTLYEDQRAFDVLVWSAPPARNSLSSVTELLIDTPSSGPVRLGDVAEVSLAPAPTIVRHDANSRYIDISANASGRDLGSVAADVERKLHSIQLPLEFHAVVLGEYQERQAAQQRLLIAGLVAMIGIFLLLQAAFESWRLALLAFLALPIAFVGGLLAVFVSREVVSLGSLVGFLAVLGIATRNGIMLINHYQHLEQQEGEPFGLGLVVRGARERLVPILMTALTAGLALVPLVAAGNIAGHEVEHPLAIVILGGLVTSTLLNLFVVPALYLRFGSSHPEGGTQHHATA